MGPTPRAWVIQSNRLHGAIAQRVHPARRHYLHGHAALDIRRVLFPLLELSLVAIQQSLMEGEILLLGHGAIAIILAIALRADLVTAACHPASVHVDAVSLDARRNDIESGERFLTGSCADAIGRAHACTPATNAQHVF